MCPNHADLVMPPRRTVRNGIETVDVTKAGQHNNGNVVVVPDEEPRTDIPTEDMVINNRRYRVPEQVIKLDFWNKIHLNRREAPARSAKRARLAATALKTATRADIDAAHLMLALLHSEDRPGDQNQNPANDPQPQQAQPQPAQEAQTDKDKATAQAQPNDKGKAQETVEIKREPAKAGTATPTRPPAASTRKVVSASPPARNGNQSSNGNGLPPRPSSTNSDSAVTPKITLRLSRPQQT